MLKSDQTDKIFAAFVAAQARLGGVFKDANNPHFKSRYASLENVIDAAKPVLSDCELGFMQHVGARTEMGISVTTLLVHTSGQYIGDTQILPIIKADPQAAGSAITYARRYGLMSMLGLPATDDDAEEACSPSSKQHPPPRPPSKALTEAMKSADSATTKAELRNWWASLKGTFAAPLGDEYPRLVEYVTARAATLPENNQTEKDAA